MRKYWTIFSLSFQNEFTYRLNFVLWRLRNVIRILLVITLWNVVFSNTPQVFGYTKDQLIAYVFMASIVSTLIMASPSNDTMGGEIGNGDLSNYLVKPISYIKYWFTRDLASKLLNVFFSIGEFVILLAIFRPDITFPQNPVNIIFAIVAWAAAVVLYFLVSKIAVFCGFWIPTNAWGFMFIVLVFLEMLSGVIFPIDVLPPLGQFLINLTPFPYLIYYPISIYVGKFTSPEVLWILVRTVLWVFLSGYLALVMWKKGLKIYGSEGR